MSTTSVSLSTIEELRDFDTALLANTIGYIDPTPAHDLIHRNCYDFDNLPLLW